MKKVFNVLDYGAVPGAEVMQHKAIQAAVDACFLSGGGEVVIPAGTFRTGGIRLRSNVTLHLLSGAVLVGSRDPEDYFILDEDTVEPVPKDVKSRGPVPDGRFESVCRKYAGRWYNGLIRAYLAEHIAVIGDKGSVIDGSNCYDEHGEEFYRGPHGISMICCRHIVLRGYTMQNSSNWPECIWHSSDILCENVVNLAGHDGIHITGCDDVIIRRCAFYTGDDCVAGFDNRNVLVEDCILNTACSAFRFGGTNMLATRCRIYAPARYSFRGGMTTEEKKAGVNANDAAGYTQRHNMLAIFTYYADYSSKIRYRPGNVVIRDCTVDGADRFLCFNFSGNSIWQCNKPLCDITFEHIKAKNLSEPLYLYGDAACPVSLTLSDVTASFRPDRGDVTFIHAGNYKSITLEDVTIRNNHAPQLIKSWNAPGKGRVIVKNVSCHLDEKDFVSHPEEPFYCQPI
ncbi:MAG: hypothetical protein MJ192_00840 [Clostridia bacterium]|nr:hypothetical protein [Clostridia bacterium]